MFEFRYTNILTVLAVAFLYSGGLPIMYPTAAIFFFITYWMDKCLLFRCYRRPIKFDNYLAKGTVGYYKYILLGHIAGFLLMYGLTPILQTNLFEQFVPTEVGLIEQEQFSLYPYYFWLIAIITALYILWVIFVRTCMKICRHCCASTVEKYESYGLASQKDFYECINYVTLRRELKSSDNVLHSARSMLQEGNHN